MQRQRLESSCQLLADPKYRRPIAELAYQHGFKDATAFSHAFRRRYGVSPTVWRQNYLGIT
ncbi:helix-turn-helix domain-containing protein [uncultured Paenalcaligenes sp.]|uniref:helix-turn-helix domain-containing protein n=1 Tax=uncultured Paenalcaligenes sp. TaxID=1588925 RepID=UPI0026106BD3|nr:helix-turn-helix domain-containing protein [uncultured Paenalcaligenes sp.]